MDGARETRRPAVAATIDVDEPAPVPGAVAALLDHLDRKLVHSTWFLPASVDAALVERLFYTGHEVAGFVTSVGEIGETVHDLTAHDVDVVGVRVTPSEPSDGETAFIRELVQLADSTALSYLSIPADAVTAVRRERRSVPRGRSLALLPAPPVSALRTNPLEWLHAIQLAIAGALQHGGFSDVRVDLRSMDRSDALSAVTEAIDLVAGLRRADRLTLDRLDRLVALSPGSR